MLPVSQLGCVCENRGVRSLGCRRVLGWGAWGCLGHGGSPQWGWSPHSPVGTVLEVALSVSRGGQGELGQGER